MRRHSLARRAALCHGVGLGLALATLPRAALSQGKYPDRPVRVLIGTPAGDSADAIAASSPAVCRRFSARWAVVVRESGAEPE